MLRGGTHRSPTSPPPQFVDIAASEGHCAAVSSAGHVYTWGKGTYGQLGLGFTVSALTPTLIQPLADAKIRVQAVSCGGEHTLARACLTWTGVAAACGGTAWHWHVVGACP